MREFDKKGRIRLDKDKFFAVAKKRGLSRKEIGHRMYKSENFVGQCFTSYGGWVKEYNVNGLCDVLECKVEDISYTEPGVEQTETQDKEQNKERNTVAELTLSELSELIYKTVYNAVLHAWESEEESEVEEEG